MGAQLLASKIVVTEEEPRIQSISGVQTSVLGAVGVSARGPVGVATLVTSFEEYLGIFGGYIANGDLTTAMEGFFRNGGSQEAHIVRTVHYTDPTDPTSKTSAAATKTLLTAAAAPTSGFSDSAVGPFVLADGDTLVVAFEAGGDQTFTVHGAPAMRASGNGPFNVDTGDGYNLTVGGISSAWTIQAGEVAVAGAATAAEIKNSLNAFLAAHSMPGVASVSGSSVHVTTNKSGTGASINFVSAIVNGANLGFTLGALAGTGNVANLAAVTASELATVAAGITNGTATNQTGALRFASATTGSSSTAQVKALSTADLKCGFDNAVHAGGSGAAVNTLQLDAKYDGSFGNALTVRIDAATSGDSDAFNLVVLSAGVVVETWPNLLIGAADAADPQYVETIVNDVNRGSKYVAATDLLAVVASPGNLPAPVTSTAFTGGNDGLAGLVDADFVGASSQTGKTGLRALDTVQTLSLLIVPGRATSAVQNAMLTYCAITRDEQAFAILDPPANTNAQQVIAYFETTAALIGLSEFGAAYWPRVKVLNPNRAVFGNLDQITVPPSGHIAGVYARNDASKQGGVYTPPAGIVNGVLQGVLDFETSEVLEEAKRDLVYPKRINPLTVFAGAPRHIDGSRTLKGTGNFPSVSERRGAIFIEQSIKAGLQYARHQNNTEALRSSVDGTVSTFLVDQTRDGAFRSTDPATAFFVDFGEALNPPSVQFAGKLVGRIGIATVKPAEYIILRFSQDTRALEEELAAVTA